MGVQWDEARLQALISDQIEESDQLEYKGAMSLQKSGNYSNEICKDVSSFANAGGGTIIYGIKEFDESSRKHLPERLDPVDRVEFTREWLDIRRLAFNHVFPNSKLPLCHCLRLNDMQPMSLKYPEALQRTRNRAVSTTVVTISKRSG